MKSLFYCSNPTAPWCVFGQDKLERQAQMKMAISRKQCIGLSQYDRKLLARVLTFI